MTSHYVGTELELFAAARNWKGYVRDQIMPFLRGRVLEVGAGIGATTRMLCGEQGVVDWVCLEPDPMMAARLRATMQSGELPNVSAVVEGTLANLPENTRFDVILYIDVVEHIEDDRRELQVAASRLAPSGSLVVLSPAHQWLFTPFDRAIGHYRRYNLSALRNASPSGVREARLRYLDSAGLIASLGNALLLRQSMPTAEQIALWDGWLVPVSRRLDWLVNFTCGKSVLGVWTKS